MGMTGKAMAAATVALLGVFSMTWAPAAQAQRGGAVNCFSSNGEYTRCPVPWRDAQLVRQDSKTDCVRNQTWGMDQRGLWVSRGCRGIFVEAERGYGRHQDGQSQDRRWRDNRSDDRGGWQPGPGWDRTIRLDCVSSDNRYQLCQVDVGRRGSVRLIRQESKNRCTEGYSWGWNRAGVWVDHGCRADFLVDRRG